MSASDAKGHDYHLVDPSPWPVIGAIAGFVTAMGLVGYMHEYWFSWLLPVGLLGIGYTMFVWWRDVIKEATFEGHHTKVVQLGMRYGMVLFIASEVMFFVAWFWAY